MPQGVDEFAQRLLQGQRARLTIHGEPPRDDDYLRTIERGLHGTAMPGFALLTQGEREALVAYVRELVDAHLLTTAPQRCDERGDGAHGAVEFPDQRVLG